MSDVKPCESISWLLNRTPNVILEPASWFWCLGIGSKLDRYVIQSLDSKSDTNASGHPRGVSWSCTVMPCVGFSVLLVGLLGADIGGPSRHESLRWSSERFSGSYWSCYSWGSAGRIPCLGTISVYSVHRRFEVLGPRDTERCVCIFPGRHYSFLFCC